MPEDKPTPAAVDHLDSTIPDEESVLSEEEAKGDDREKKLVEEEESKVEDESIGERADNFDFRTGCSLSNRLGNPAIKAIKIRCSNLEKYFGSVIFL